MQTKHAMQQAYRIRSVVLEVDESERMSWLQNSGTDQRRGPSGGAWKHSVEREVGCGLPSVG